MLERRGIAIALGLALAAPPLAAAAGVAHVVPRARVLAWAAGIVVALALFALAVRAAPRLPVALDGSARRRPLRATLWLLLVLVAFVQLGRLCAFIADPTNTWGSAFPDPGLTRHMCMTAYVHAADLARRHEPNLYAEEHWPAFRTDPPPVSSPVAELGERVEDPYEYPPQFLLLPRLALALTDHFLAIRAVWFAVQAIAFILVALLLAGFVGGREGLVIGLLTPALVASLPGMVNLQWGQAHLMTFLLSLGAMLAFARGRDPLGGALLGAATVFKLFPGLLLLLLLFRRRWRAAGWTIGAGVALTLVALAVVGADPFVAFARYQLPRIGSGEAFSFFRREWFYVSRNFGVSGLVFKLGLFGVPGMTAGVASAVGWLYTALLVWLTLRAARHDEGDGLGEAMVWMALLCLGSLRSPLAPSIYVSLGAIWLLTLLAGRATRARDVVLIVLLWIVIPGDPPLPIMAVDVLLALVGQLAMIALAVYAILRRR